MLWLRMPARPMSQVSAYAPVARPCSMLSEVLHVIELLGL